MKSYYLEIERVDNHSTWLTVKFLHKDTSEANEMWRFMEAKYEELYNIDLQNPEPKIPKEDVFLKGRLNGAIVNLVNKEAETKVQKTQLFALCYLYCYGKQTTSKISAAYEATFSCSISKNCSHHLSRDASSFKLLKASKLEAELTLEGFKKAEEFIGKALNI